MQVVEYRSTSIYCRNKGGISCIPNSTTEVWTVVDVGLLIDISIQLDQHVSSNDTLHQDLIYIYPYIHLCCIPIQLNFNINGNYRTVL